MMKQLSVSLVLGFLVAAGLVYCVQPPDYPAEPVIEFVSVTPTRMLQLPFFRSTDSVYTDIVFRFTDGDGDLGFEDNSTSLIVTDTRLPNIPLSFSLPVVPDEGSGNGISGTVLVRVPVSCCIPGFLNGVKLPDCDTLSPSMQLLDTVYYTLKIKDRAGNWSNEVTCAPVELICRR